MKILITGANGFVGKALCPHLVAQGHKVVPVVRKSSGISHGILAHDELSWKAALKGCDSIIHLAARVHIMAERDRDSLQSYRNSNVVATIALANRAVAAGVQRFIFISSIKVNGESTKDRQPFTAEDEPAPEDSYGISKFEAEEALHQIARETGMEVVIIRPPLVYGPGVKANFESMMRWLRRGIPLPLGALTQNKRSMVALDNLVDLISVCLSHPSAVNQTFLVSDGEDLSTATLLQRTAIALGVNVRLFSVPPVVLKSLAKLLGKETLYKRLCGSLQIDMTKTQKLLHWKPPLSIEKGLSLAARGDQ
jgi:nucleoside-diphosphate-sugar epimerase